MPAGCLLHVHLTPVGQHSGEEVVSVLVSYYARLLLSLGGSEHTALLTTKRHTMLKPPHSKRRAIMQAPHHPNNHTSPRFNECGHPRGPAAQNKTQHLHRCANSPPQPCCTSIIRSMRSQSQQATSEACLTSPWSERATKTRDVHANNTTAYPHCILQV